MDGTEHHGWRFASTLVIALFLLAAAPAVAAASTYVVNETGDQADAVSNNDHCDVDTGTAGDQCTLRAALQEADNHPGSTIKFSVAGTITLGSDLPAITQATTIDGYTDNPGASRNTNAGFLGDNASIKVVVAGNGHSTFAVTADGTTIKGLDVQHSATEGILISSSNNHIEGNFIGTSGDGTTAQGNAGAGVRITTGNGNTIGGTAAAQRNVISDNGRAGFVPLHPGYGVSIEGGSSNIVAGNIIGLNAAGDTGLGNLLSAVRVDGDGTDNVVGGTDPGAGNVLSASGNPQQGWGVFVGPGSGTGFKILGNRIGTDVTGTVAIGNNPDGIETIHGAGVQIGDAAGHGNLVSGNVSQGIYLNSSDNTLLGNRIGTTADGTAALPNGSAGVYGNGQHGTHIGGTGPGEGNLISGNGGHGINLAEASHDSFIQGNSIGTNLAGGAALANSFDGVLVSGGSNDLISGNLISGNGASGVVLAGSEGGPGTGHTVSGNRIGTDAAGTAPVGNGQHGVWISAAANSLIGGIGAGNTIMFNTGAGVAVGRGVQFGVLARRLAAPSSDTGNRISANSIDLNGGLGIDLLPFDVQPNSPGAHADGPNLFQNYPVLSSATPGASTTVAGTLNSGPDTVYAIEFFDSPGCDASGNGEGRTFIGSTSVTTNSAGDASFSVKLAPTVPIGHVVTATATDPAGNTSEFSACRASAAAPVTPVTPTVPQQRRCRDTKPPVTTLRLPGVHGTGGDVHIAAAGTGITLHGTSHDNPNCPSGVRIVQVSLARVAGENLVNCRFFKRPNRYRLRRRGNCRRPILFTAQGTTHWTFTFPVQLRPGSYRVVARATDFAGNKETPKKGRNIVPFDQP